MDLSGITLDQRTVLVNLLFDFNGGGQRGAQKFEGLLDNGLDPQGMKALLPAPAEGENLLDEVLGPICGNQYFLGILFRLAARLQFQSQELRITDNGS